MANSASNIADLLNKARRENDEQREKDKKELAEELNKVINGQNEKNENKVEEKSKEKNETDALIDKYSQRQKTVDEKTSSDALRESLTSQMENDKELFNYYRSIESRGKSKKVTELYNLINYATQSDEEKLEGIRKENADDAGNHFTERSENEKKQEYSQQKFFDMTDTIVVPTEGVDKELAEFDEDYNKLSEKITKQVESGEMTFSDDDTRQIPLIKEKQPFAKHDADMDSKDRDLLKVFGISVEKDKDEDLPKSNKFKERSEQNGRKKQEALAYEYVDRSQNSEIHQLLTKAVRSATFGFFISLLICLVIVYLELSYEGSPYHPDFLAPGRNGILYVLYDVQALCFMAIFQLKSFIKGGKSLFTGKPCGESVFFASFCVAILHSALTVIMNPSADAGLICLPAAVCGLVMAFIKMLECRKDYHCFKIVASTRSKYVAQKLGGDAKEAMEFYKYLFEDSEIYTTRKTDFVEGFFRRLNTRPESEFLSGFAVILSAIVSLVLAGYKLYQQASAYEAITLAAKAMAFSFPISSLLVVTLPVIKANLIGKKNGSAFIGNAVGEEYADASVISFSDTEVYPSNLVKISSVKVFGDCGIDTILTDIAQVFSFVGGPLKTVTENMMGNIIPKVENSRLIESAQNGICVVLNGKEMFLGKKEYLNKFRFATPYDSADAEFEKKNGSVMYVSSGDSLIGKIYIRYTISPQFNSLLRDLYKAGMCVGIKTIDPNITTELIEKSVKFKKTPISILKAGNIRDIEASGDKIDSGVVANASLHTFLRMFIVCDRIRHVTKANGIINMLSLAIAFFVAFFLAFTNQLYLLPSWYPALFQIIWLLPVTVVSFLL